MFEIGDRVKCPGGVGEIRYRRMEGPNYLEVESYCVYLEGKSSLLDYSGTVYPANQVQAIATIEPTSELELPFTD